MSDRPQRAKKVEGQEAPVPPVKLAENALKGPVTDIFRQTVPELGGMTREQAYEKVMSTPPLLEACFKIFRKRPQLFAEVLIDAERRPVSEADAKLSCGQSLNETVTAVVRGCARRYFRAELDTPRRSAPRPPSKDAPSLWQNLMALVRPATPSPVRKPSSPSERLYRAMRNVLLYEWQVPLIPYYAPLPVRVVSEMGARLLELREPAQLVALARGHQPEIHKPKLPPVVLPERNDGLGGALAIEAPLHSPQSLVGKDGGWGLDVEATWRLWKKMDGAEIFSDIPEHVVHDAVLTSSMVQGDLVTSLLYVVGLDSRQMLVLLTAAALKLDKTEFVAMFGTPGRMKPSNALCSRLALDGVSRERNLGVFRYRVEEALDQTIAKFDGKALV